ncbi:MAG TPA: AMP-binding protein, partial [Bacteroidales bacterium]|nr:AMP-binding protein [Bacteroidales bacterium]
MMKENLTEFIQNSIRNNWNHIAMTDYRGEDLKYSQIAEKILKLHAIFDACDIKKGDKIALIGKNSSNWGISYIATILFGAVIVPVLPDFKPNDIHHIVNHSDSVLLFCSDSIFESLDENSMNEIRCSFSLSDFSVITKKELPDGLKQVMDTMNEQFKMRYPEGLKPSDIQFKLVDNSEIAVISYTSGTTGFTKGVLIPHNSLTANVVYANHNMPLEPGDNIVSFLPLAHAYGCAFEFLWPFTLGCHITFLTKSPSPQVVMQAFKEVRPRLILSVPLVIEKIYKNQILPVVNKAPAKTLLRIPFLKNIVLSKIREKLIDVFGGNFHEVVIGGAPLSHEVEVFFNKIRFPFSIGYGMTECGPLISYANWDKTRLESAGKIVDTMEVTIDSNDPYNEVGEIFVRGENVMQGYYKNPEATKAAIDDNGWLHTGDLGIIDKDNFIYIKGRSKSMILGSSGQNIYPEEIEARLSNLSYIQESLVVEKNNKLIALIYPDQELINKNKISDTELKEILEQHRKAFNHELPVYMNLIEIRIHNEEFEKTPKKSI